MSLPAVCLYFATHYHQEQLKSMDGASSELIYAISLAEPRLH